MIWFIPLIALFVLLSAFFSGMETALVSCSRIRIRHSVESGNKKARVIQRLLETPEKVLATTLVGTNIGNIAASSLATYLIIHFGHPQEAELLNTLIMVPIILVFGEILPKAFCYHRADILVLWFADILKGFSTVLAPVISITSWPATMLLKLTKKTEYEGKFPLSREELQMLVKEGHRDGTVTPQKAKMIYRTFDFGHTPVGNIMIPLQSVVSLGANSSVSQAVSIVTNSGYSRLLVLEEKNSHILGIVVATDLLGLKPDAPIKPLIRPVSAVKATTRLEHLLIQMQESQHPLTVVVDRKNIPLGIVTIEDIVEEIVGEIEDEFDR